MLYSWFGGGGPKLSVISLVPVNILIFGYALFLSSLPKKRKKKNLFRRPPKRQKKLATSRSNPDGMLLKSRPESRPIFGKESFFFFFTFTFMQFV